MATGDAVFTIAAEDRTQAAFRSIKQSILGVDSAAGQLNSTLAKLGIGISAAGVLAYFKSVLQSADELGKLAQKVGTSVEALSQYNVAARLANVSTDVLQVGLRNLAKAQGEISSGGSKAADALKALGISQKDISAAGGDTIKMFDLVAERLAGFRDDANKTALAVAIFGRSGEDLIPLINDLSKTRDEAAQLGALIGGDVAAQAQEFNDQLTRLNIRVEAFSQKMALKALPALNDWVEANLKALQIAGSLGEALRLFVFNLNAMTSEKPAEEIRRLTKEIDELGASIRKNAAWGVKQEDLGWFTQQIADRKKQIELLKYLQQQEALKNTGPQTYDARDLMAHPALAPKPSAPALPDEAAIARAKKLADAYQLQQDTQAAFAASMAQARENEFNSEEKLKQQLDGLTKSQDKFNQEVQKWKDFADPMDAYKRQLAEVDKLYQDGKLSADEWAEATMKLNDAMWDQGKKSTEVMREQQSLLQQLGDVFTSAFEDAVVGGGNLRDVLNGLLQDIARVILKMKVLTPLLEWLFGNGKTGSGATAGVLGAVIDAVFGGGKAIGGPVSAGTAYLVGERGPELFVPPVSGTIVPNGQLGRGTPSVAIYQTISVDARADISSVRSAMEISKRETIREVTRQLLTGGQLATAAGKLPA